MDTAPDPGATNRTIAATAVGLALAYLAAVLLVFLASLLDSDGWGAVFAMIAGAAALPVLPGLLVGTLVARSPAPGRAAAVTALVLVALPPLAFVVLVGSTGF